MSISYLIVLVVINFSSSTERHDASYKKYKRSVTLADMPGVEFDGLPGINQDAMQVNLAKGIIEQEEEREKLHVLNALRADPLEMPEEKMMLDEDIGWKKGLVDNGQKTSSVHKLESLGFDMDSSDDGSGAGTQISKNHKIMKKKRKRRKKKTSRSWKRYQEYPEFRLDHVGMNTVDNTEDNKENNYGTEASEGNSDHYDGNEYFNDHEEQPKESDEKEQVGENDEIDEEDEHSQEHMGSLTKRPKPHFDVGLRPTFHNHENSDKRTINDVTLAEDSSPRGIQPDQDLHTEDIRNIQRLQKEHLIRHFEDDGDMEDSDGEMEDSDGDSETNENEDDDDDDDDDGTDEKSRHGVLGYSDGFSVQKDRVFRVNNSSADQIDQMENIENVREQNFREPTKESTGEKKTLLVHKDGGGEEKLLIPDESLQESHNRGLDEINDSDHVESDSHVYHIHHPPNHIQKHIHHYQSKEYNTYKHSENPCQNGGIFAPFPNHGHVCICPQRFMGKNCEDINYCHHRPCRHCGKCQVTHHWPHYKCECCRKYSGTHCEIRNPCEPNPCYNRGECTHDGHTPSCICKSKFKGTFCDEVNNCKPNPCLNGGKCLERPGIGSFSCTCEPGWLGTICEIPSKCTDKPCHNGGTCQENGDKFKCICDMGFRGPTCSEKLCLPNPCYNGGTCVENGNQYHCVCPPWAMGPTCTEISPCLMHPCKNGARCVDAYTGFRWTLNPMQYYCLCQPPFHGPHCEHNPCLHCDIHSHCDVDDCVCDAGWEGDGQICTKIPLPCHPNPCANGGICVDEGHGFFHCLCKPKYKLPYCITPIYCEPNPCNGGICVPMNNGYKCINCPDGFTGQTCSVVNPCKPNPCHNHGVCTGDSDGSFTCRCLGMWEGELCEKCGCKKSTDPKIPSPFCDKSGDCQCPYGYELNQRYTTCQKNNKTGISICLSNNPCKCNAECIANPDDDNDYFCKCPTKCYGNQCQFRKVCFQFNPCKNGGTCIDLDGKNYRCNCKSGFAGVNCTVLPTVTPITNPCKPNPCHNSGICVRSTSSYDCKCLTRFTGPNCGIDKCDDCDEHAKCFAGECICRRGYIGNGYDCIKECAGKCLELQFCNNGVCDCMSGYQQVQGACARITDTKKAQHKNAIPTHSTARHTHSFPSFVTHFTKPTQRTFSTAYHPTISNNNKRRIDPFPSPNPVQANHVIKKTIHVQPEMKTGHNPYHKQNFKKVLNETAHHTTAHHSPGLDYKLLVLPDEMNSLQKTKTGKDKHNLHITFHEPINTTVKQTVKQLPKNEELHPTVKSPIVSNSTEKLPNLSNSTEKLPNLSNSAQKSPMISHSAGKQINPTQPTVLLKKPKKSAYVKTETPGKKFVIDVIEMGREDQLKATQATMLLTGWNEKEAITQKHRSKMIVHDGDNIVVSDDGDEKKKNDVKNNEKKERLHDGNMNFKFSETSKDHVTNRTSLKFDHVTNNLSSIENLQKNLHHLKDRGDKLNTSFSVADSNSPFNTTITNATNATNAEILSALNDDISDFDDDEREHHMIDLLKSYGENIDDEIYEISEDGKTSDKTSPAKKRVH